MLDLVALLEKYSDHQLMPDSVVLPEVEAVEHESEVQSQEEERRLELEGLDSPACLYWIAGAMWQRLILLSQMLA
jgi:hypothetical protein